MKLSKDKKQKGLESTIGKIIYGFLLFAPLLAILSAVIINTFNFSSRAEINYKYETNDVSTINDLKIGNIYHLSLNANNRPTSTQRILVDEVYNLDTSTASAYSTTTSSDIPNFAFTTSSTYYYFYTLETRYYGYQISGNFECDIVYRGNVNFDKISLLSKCTNIPIESVENLDAQEVFYSALDRTEQSEIFNWSKNTGIYTVLNTTCNGLGITNTFTPFLMAYWLLVSVIYFVYDIGLMLVMVMHRHIHELQESM